MDGSIPFCCSSHWQANHVNLCHVFSQPALSSLSHLERSASSSDWARPTGYMHWVPCHACYTGWTCMLCMVKIVWFLQLIYRLFILWTPIYVVVQTPLKSSPPYGKGSMNTPALKKNLWVWLVQLKLEDLVERWFVLYVLRFLQSSVSNNPVRQGCVH